MKNYVKEKRIYEVYYSFSNDKRVQKIISLLFKTRKTFPKFKWIAKSIVFNTSHRSADEFYDFTPEDYYHIQRTRQKEDKFLKTQKIREAEDAKRRSKITKAVIRVRFPDNRTVDATFHPSDKIQSLVDYLRKVGARPELPFYLFTAPPKQVLRDMSQDFYSAGFVPGAVVHLSLNNISLLEPCKLIFEALFLLSRAVCQQSKRCQFEWMITSV
ncbi:tether containing UBX domain for GLUT4-like [Pyrus ussuriensis x Pyrus communis]|uniref:Tether containing UBX domain for GLUT4-like n=1 Tax=Pyrus ussuriensis x Pyrus communis TaxID=2448454 RepID=A0A5N5FWD5_9ROSA|nr:tether containing UBX domain for GLUT4-like [Pyrus ussuriensis x Pyrus communis]